jgi:hypothetical protein
VSGRLLFAVLDTFFFLQLLQLGSVYDMAAPEISVVGAGMRSNPRRGQVGASRRYDDDLVMYGVE